LDLSPVNRRACESAWSPVNRRSDADQWTDACPIGDMPNRGQVEYRGALPGRGRIPRKLGTGRMVHVWNVCPVLHALRKSLITDLSPMGSFALRKWSIFDLSPTDSSRLSRQRPGADS
jgi:hypothetical protein